MAWLTGKVQQFDAREPNKEIVVGSPLAELVNGKWYSLESGQELTAKEITSAEIREKVLKKLEMKKAIV